MRKKTHNDQGDLMKNLRKGSSGSLVSMAQLALKRAGFYNGILDGIFSIKTESAVRYFQYLNRLKTDGVIDTQTWTILEKYIKGFFRYSLKRGDTYWLLANKYSTSVKAIMLANPDINENFLKVGQMINIPFGFNVVPCDIPYSSYLVKLVVHGLITRYPFMELSVAGENIYCIKTGTGNREVFYNASQYADEWITTPLLLKFLEQYASACAFGGRINGADAAKLYSETTLFTIPLVNPDGVDFVTGAFSDSDCKGNSEKISEISFPDGRKVNISETALNINCPITQFDKIYRDNIGNLVAGLAENCLLN